LCTTGRHTIRKSSAAGSSGTSTYVGSSGNAGSNEGSLGNARFSSPSTIAIDTLTNIFVADTSNHKIRKVTIATTTVSTVVGTATNGYNGDGVKATNAQLNAPYGVDVDSLGNIYIADTGNNRIRFVNISTSIITTLLTGYTPQYIDTDKFGNSYFSDLSTARV
jgi:hypothetical protein